MIDYDAIAPNYDRRYAENEYGGVERAVLAFVGAATGAVLEVGCGTGHWLGVLDGLGRRGAGSLGIDRSWGMLERARRAMPAAALVRAEAERLPCRSASADRLFCVNAFHHFVDKAAF